MTYRASSWTILWSIGRYVLALIFVGLAILFRWAQGDILKETPYLAFYPAVVLAAAVGGFGPGVVAALASSILLDLLFTPPLWVLNSLQDPIEFSRQLIFVIGGIGVSALAGLLRRARRQERLQSDAVREQRERLSFILESAGLGAWDMEVATRQIQRSAQHDRIFGYNQPLVQWNYDTLLQHVLDEDREKLDRSLQRSLSCDADWDCQCRIRRRDGVLRWLWIRGRMVSAGGGHPLSIRGLLQDITDHKLAEEALAAAKVSAERAKASAEHATQAKDHFLAVLSHELRTPLAPVLATVSLMMRAEQVDADTRQSLEMVQRNVEMEARLIDDLLDVTRIARGKVELLKQPAELGTIIRRAVEVCQADLEARQLHLTLDMGPARQYSIEADAARLQQVFWNLLKNAIKFTSHGGNIAIRCWSEGMERVVVEVSDNGVGIASGSLGKIFNAFEQAERSITRQFGGLGLGLAISKALVDMHGGSIEAHSEGKGKGATFRVRLPLLADHAARVAVKKSSGHAPTVSDTTQRKALKILLVEDHVDTAQAMARLLGADGHQVQTAGDLASAVQKVGEESFDLLISDLGLPDGSGLELLQKLLAGGHHLPAIALSGYGQEQDIQRSLAAGFKTHLTKPVDIQHLRNAIISSIV